jgi:peptidoglycan/xylan/chitin deacetylase (PgdA/CDA1 family)
VRSSAALRNRSGRAVFLCYHSIAPHGPKYLTVTAELFERQLAELRRRGFGAGGREELAAIAAGKRRPPSVFLTFDDGFRDNHSTVLPLLREYGFTGFVFVLPPLVDTGGALDWPEMAEDLKLFPDTMRSVTWDLVEEMAEGGFEVGAHTLTHPHLPTLDGERLRAELSDSRARVKERLGRCDTIAYPFGECSPAVVAAARDCGYRYAFTLPTHAGQRGASPMTIPRLNVDYRDSGRRFALKLSTLGRAAILSPGVNRLRG